MAYRAFPHAAIRQNYSTSNAIAPQRNSSKPRFSVAAKLTLDRKALNGWLSNRWGMAEGSL